MSWEEQVQAGLVLCVYLAEECETPLTLSDLLDALASCEIALYLPSDNPAAEAYSRYMGGTV